MIQSIVHKRKSTSPPAIYTLVLLYVVLLMLFSCGFSKEQNTIVVYLDANIVLDDVLIKEAYQIQNIDMEFVTRRQKKIIDKRLVKYPDAPIRWRAKYILNHIDVYISADFEFVNRLKKEGFLQDMSALQPPLESLETVRPQFVDKAFQWVGISARPKVMVYNASLSKHTAKFSLLHGYMALSTVDDKKVIASYRRSQSFMQFIAFLIYTYGAKETDEWMRAINDSLAMRPTGDEIRQIQYLDTNVALLTFADMSMIKKMQASYDPLDRSIVSRLGFVIPFDNLFLSVNTMGIMKSTNRLALSKQFIDFLLSPSAQYKISTDNYDYPTVKNAPMSSFLSSWGAFPIISWDNISDYYQYLPEAKALIKKYQW